MVVFPIDFFFFAAIKPQHALLCEEFYSFVPLFILIYVIMYLNMKIFIVVRDDDAAAS